MREDNILSGFLEKLTEDAIKQIEKEGTLSQQNALPFLIKDQYTKITQIQNEFASRGDVQNLHQEMCIKFKEVEYGVENRSQDGGLFILT